MKKLLFVLCLANMTNFQLLGIERPEPIGFDRPETIGARRLEIFGLEEERLDPMGANLEELPSFIPLNEQTKQLPGKTEDGKIELNIYPYRQSDHLDPFTHKDVPHLSDQKFNSINQSVKTVAVIKIKGQINSLNFLSSPNFSYNYMHGYTSPGSNASYTVVRNKYTYADWAKKNRNIDAIVIEGGEVEIFDPSLIPPGAKVLIFKNTVIDTIVDTNYPSSLLYTNIDPSYNQESKSDQRETFYDDMAKKYQQSDDTLVPSPDRKDFITYLRGLGISPNKGVSVQFLIDHNFIPTIKYWDLLDLSNFCINSLNGLENIPEKWTRLELSNNNLTHIDNSQLPADLTHLTLDNNKITSFDFRSLKTNLLSTLDLTKNPLETIDFSNIENQRSGFNLSFSSKDLTNINGILQLQKTNPNIKIYIDDKGPYKANNIDFLPGVNRNKEYVEIYSSYLWGPTIAKAIANTFFK